jgi:NADH-quinone oxidoreductase subunit L
MIFSTLVATLGIVLAWIFCLKGWPGAARRAAARWGRLYELSFHRWWWDDAYNAVFAGGLRRLAAVATWLDRIVVDGLVHGIGDFGRGLSRELRAAQNGQVQAYALAILLGVNLILLLVLVL